MKKATIFYGNMGNDHRGQAINLACSNGSNYLYLSARDLPETIIVSNNMIKSVIIDECPNDFDFERYLNSITSNPETKFIFCTIKKPRMGASFKARFELIDAADMWRDLPF